MPAISIKRTIHACCPSVFKPTLARIEASEIGYRLAKGAFWSLFGAVVSRLLGLVSFVIVARVLGKAGYGQFGIIQSTVGMFGVFAGFGLGQTATKYVAELRDKDPVRAGRIMGMAGLVAIGTGLLMAGVLFSFAPWLASRTLADASLTPLLRVGALILVLEAMNGAQVGALSGFEAFKTIAKINAGVGLASFPMMVVGVYFGDLEGSVWALAVNRAFNWLLNHLALRREASRAGVPFSWRGSNEELGVLWRFSLPSMLAGVMVTPTLWICNTLLVNQPGGYEQMGILQASRLFQQALMFMGATLGAPMLPMLANIISSGGDNERFGRINMLLTWFLGAFPALLLISLPEVGQAVFGKQFIGQDFTNTYLLMLFSTSIIIYKQGLARALSAHGLMWWGMCSNLFWAIIMIISTRFLISWGAPGYSAAWTCAYIVNTIVFIPLYTHKGLVPIGTIVSFKAGLIWLCLIVAVTLNFLDASIVLRLIFLPVAAVTMFWMFFKLLTNK